MDLPDQEQEEIKKVTVQISQEPNPPNEDRGIGSQVKDPLMKVNIPRVENGSQNQYTQMISVKGDTVVPCVVMLESGAENNSWVKELEEIIRNGDPLPRSELFKLAEYRLGEYVHLYRESGRVLDADPNDISQEFLRFVQWYSFNGKPDISFVRLTVKKCERNPEQWDVLLDWLKVFQEVQANPEYLQTILKGKVASQGRNPNSQDLAAINRINFEKSMSAENWWELV